MNLKIGIVGLPNVGKSTLFNALTKSQKAAAENFPFCTIDPNIGIVEVPDQRIDTLTRIVQPERVVRSIVEFVDIAGLVEGASRGEGLGNKFLSHIRECNAICHVLRDFESTDIHHVYGKVDPKNDLEIIITELIFADLESVERQIERTSKKAKSGDKDAKAEVALLERYKTVLQEGGLARTVECDEKEEHIARRFQLLTNKPFIIVANVSESDFSGFDEYRFREKIGGYQDIPIVPICAQIEAELASLSPDDSLAFLQDIGAEKSGLESLIQKGFEILKLQNYFTAGVKEVRSWTIYKGDTAPRAAAAIHTDFEKGFIRAETIAFHDFVAFNGEAGAKENGKMRTEGRDYVVQDGDILHFRFNV